MKFFAVLAFSFVFSIVAQAAPNLETVRTADATINISVPGFGASFPALLDSYRRILEQAQIHVEDVKVTAVNGYGKPMAGFIKTSMPLPENAKIETISYELLPNCAYGDIFSSAQTYMNTIKMMNGQVVTFLPTSHNGNGKPCSATIGWYRRVR